MSIKMIALTMRDKRYYTYYKRVFLLVVEVFCDVEKCIIKHMRHFALLQISKAHLSGFFRIHDIKYLREVSNRCFIKDPIEIETLGK